MDNNTLIRYVISLADDSMILGQRLAELCSRGPYLEEDLAITNVTLDYIGRASMFYQYAAQLKNEGDNENECGDSDEDKIAFFRDEREYTNLLINELPNGDFAFTLLKQFYIDVFNNLYLEQLMLSKDSTLAAIAAKAIKESRYHLKRSIPWIEQLAGGTEESLERLCAAIDELQAFIGELFFMQDWETELVSAGIAVDRPELQAKWDDQVSSHFKHCGLNFQPTELKIKGGRDGIHTEHLGHLLSEMQFLQRANPGLEW